MSQKQTNPIKSAYTKTRVTQEQFEEYKKCIADPVYFIETYMRVRHPVKGNIPFKLYPYQKEIIEVYHTNKNAILLTGRQMGKTETTVGYLLWYAMFNKDSTILVAGNVYRAALEIMKRIRYAYEQIPDWLKPGVIKYARESVEFDNGSTILSQATTENTGRGLSLSILYVDEFAFVQPRMAEEFWTSISPTLSTGGKCLITSTPNSGEDTFAQIWFAASNILDQYGNEHPRKIGKNGFRAYMAQWNRHPERDQAWADEQIGKVGEDQFKREHNCEFISADPTLITGRVIKDLNENHGKDPKRKTDEIRWYGDVEPNRTYLVSLDPCSGVDRDYSAIQVFKLPELEQVAEWRDNRTDIRGQVTVLHQVLMQIHATLKSHPAQQGTPELYWTLENNSGFGDAAMLVIQDTGEDKFPGEFVSEPRKPGVTRHRKGMNTNSKTKVAACMRFKSLIESYRMKLHSKALIREINFFVAKGGSFAAKPGETDDLISACLLVTRMIEVVQQWDDSFSDRLKEVVDMDDYEVEPMPFSVMIG